MVDVHTVDPPTFYWRMRFVHTLERVASREGIVLYIADRHEELRKAAEEWFRRAERDFRMAMRNVDDELVIPLFTLS